MTQLDRVVEVQRCDMDSLGRVRSLPGIDVFDTGDAVWVRGSAEHSENHDLLASLPGRHLRVNDDNALFRDGDILASEWLDNPNWIPIGKWLKVDVLSTGWPGQLPTQRRMRLIPSNEILECVGLLTDMESLAEFVTRTAEFRFTHLRFAVNRNGNAFVTGNPLPPLQGTRFHLTDDVAVPAGLRWTPEVDAATLRKVFGDPGGTILWIESDRWELIPTDGFAAVNRASVRASLAAGKMQGLPP